MAKNKKKARKASKTVAAKTPAAPRAILEKADPLEVERYFESTGLTRKQLASAVGVSTSVIATVQNPKGDRWSAKRFAAAKPLIDKYAREHATEIQAARDADAASAKAAAAKTAARTARAAARVSKLPSVKKAARVKAKVGRPGKPRRAANRKPALQATA